MARIQQTGWEHGSLAYFNGGAGDTAMEQTIVRNGIRALLIGGNSVVGTRLLVAPETEVYGRIAFRTNSVSTTHFLLRFIDGVTEQASIQKDAARVRVLRGGATVLETSAENVFEVNNWHLLEWHLLIADSGGRFEVKVDGVQAIDFTGDTKQTTNTDFDRMQWAGGGTGVNVYYDDFALNNVSGTEHNSWIGEGKGIGIFPNAAGDVTQLSRGGSDSGANWSQVDEKPPNDATDYVFSDTVNQYDLYNLDDVTNVGTVNAISIWHRAQKDDADDRSFARMLKSGGTENQGADTVLTQSWVYYNEILERDPTDSAVWTQAKINALQAGFKVR